VLVPKLENVLNDPVWPADGAKWAAWAAIGTALTVTIGLEAGNDSTNRVCTSWGPWNEECAGREWVDTSTGPEGAWLCAGNVIVWCVGANAGRGTTGACSGSSAGAGATCTSCAGDSS